MRDMHRSMILSAALLAPLVGCDDSTSTPVDASADAVAITDAPSPDVATGNDGGADGGAGLRFLTRLDAAMGQLPEGVAYREGSLYVGYAPTGQIVRIDASGTATMYAQVPIPPSASPTAPNGYLLGLAFNAAGTLFAAAPSFGAAFQAGVYRVPAGGGTATLFARDAMGRMNFPNGIDFDAAGNLFVTDSGSGSVFRVSADGMTVEQWVTDASLRGVMGANPCGPGAGFPIGANGIVYDAAGGNVYVTNTDHATLVRIPIAAGGAAGAPAVIVAQNCSLLGGADGLTRGPDNKLYIAANAANAITRVAFDGTNPAAVDLGGLLDSPASIAFGALSGAASMFVTNAAFTSAQTPGATPRPGVLVRAQP